MKQNYNLVKAVDQFNATEGFFESEKINERVIDKTKNKFLSYCFFIVLLIAGGQYAFSQTAVNYGFSVSSGTYSPITTAGGATNPATAYADDVNVNITGLTAFNYNGTNYTSFQMNSNGRLSLYTTAPTITSTYTPLSTAITNALVVIAPFGADLSVSTAATSGWLYQTTGGEHIFQWNNVSRYSSSGNNDILNFQIRLNIATGNITFVYGTCTLGSNPVGQPQIGFRGSGITYATDINNLYLNVTGSPATCDWSNAVTGQSATSAMYLNTANTGVKPLSGLTYTWTKQSAPAPVRTFAAVTAIGSGGATVSWTAPTGATTYNIQHRAFGTCAWTNWSGNPVATNTVTLTGLASSTAHQVRVQAVNSSSLASIYSHIPNTAGTGDGYTATGTFTTLSTSPTINAGTLSAFSSQCINSTYGPNNFTVTGTNLTADIVVGALTGYTYSETTGGSYTTTLTLGQTAGSLSKTVYVKFSPVAATSYSGNIPLTSTGATTVTVAASGTGINTMPTLSSNGTAAPGIGSVSISGITISSLGCSTPATYGIEYGTSPTLATSTQAMSTDFTGSAGGTFSVALPTLANNTIYYYRAFAINNGGKATYSTISSFTTLCAAVSFPWTENFDSVTTPAIPACWTKQNGDWITTTNANATQDADARSGANFLRESFSATNEYMWSPGFQLTAGTTYRYAFYWAGDNLAGWTGDIFYNTSPASASATQMGASFVVPATTTSKTYQLVFRDFTPSANGIYYFAVRINATSGPWYLSFDDFSFGQAPTCNPPSGLSGIPTAHNTANVSWTAPAVGDAAIAYEYAVITSSTSPASGTPNTGTSVTGISGLSGNTTYYLHVRTNCGAGVYSSWAVSSFVTPCTPLVPAYTNDFSTFPGTCWSAALSGGTPATGPSDVTAYWAADGFLNNGTTGAAKINLYDSARIGWLKTVPFNLSAGGYRVKFNYGITDYAVTTPAPTTATDDVIQVLISENNGATWAVLQTWNSPNSTISNTVNQFVLNLTGYTGANTVFAIYASAGTTVNDPDYEFFIDDFTIETQPVTAIATGNFATGSNWSNGTGPTCGLPASIPSGIEMTVSSGTAAVSNLEIAGKLFVTGGTLTVGNCTGNNAFITNSGTVNVSGGTLAVNGNINNLSGSTFVQSNGDIIIDGNNNNNPATSVASGTPLLSFASPSVTLSDGTITITDPHTATLNTNGYALYANIATSVNASALHTLKFGDGTSAEAGGHTSGFYISPNAGAGRINFSNVTVNNPSGTNRNVVQASTFVANGNLTVTAGTYNQNAIATNIGGNLSVGNASSYIASGTTAFGSTTGTSAIAQQSTAQSISVTGTGTILNAATGATGNFTGISFNNNSSSGVTINPLNQISGNSQVAANAISTITFNGKVATTGGRALLMGTIATMNVTLTVTSGGMLPGSAFARGWTAGQTGSAFTAGTIPAATSQFPLLDASGNARYAWIERVTPTAAGITSVNYTDAAGTTDVSITDGAYTIEKRTNGKWNISLLGTALTSASYKFAVSGVNAFGGAIASGNARVITATAALGTHLAGTTLPHAQRTGFTIAELTGNDFYMGIANSELTFVSIASGNWNDAATWSKGAVPTATDVVTIAAGHTVTINGSYTAAALSLAVNASGVLDVTANTLALGSLTNNGTVTISGGTVTTTTTITNTNLFNATGGTVTATTALTNSGTLTINGGTVNTTTSVTNNGTIAVTSGSVNVTTTMTNGTTGILNVNGGNVNVTTTLTNSAGGNVNLSSGTLAVASTYTNTGTFTGTGGTLNVTGASTTGITNSGTFTVNGVTVNVGVTDNSVANRRFSNTGALTVAAGNLTIYGNIAHSAGSLTQSGGTIKIDGNAAGSAANSVASGTPLFNMTSTNINLTGGTLLFTDPHTATSATSGYTIYMSSFTASNVSLGASALHTTQFGDGTSTDAGGHTSGFYNNAWISTAYLSLGNVIINGGSGTNRNVTNLYGLTASGNVQVNTGSKLTSDYVIVGKDLIVNTGATLISTTSIDFALVTSNDDENLYYGLVTAAQAITNNGTMANSATTVTANAVGLYINNSNATGVTLNNPLSVSSTLSLATGKLNTTATNLLTLGTSTLAGTLAGGSSSAYINGPFARTFPAGRTATGTYTVATMFPVGKAGTFLPVYADPTTTATGPVVIKGEAFTSNTGALGEGVTGLSSNRWEVLPVSGSSNLTNAFIRLGATGISSASKIIQAATAGGTYNPIIPSISYLDGAPNTISTGSGIAAADYTGYFAYGTLNSCPPPAGQPANFTVSAQSATTLTASYTAAAAASHYLVVRYLASETPVTPTDNNTYSGSALGGTVAYSGVATTFNQTGLTANTAYTYYVYAYNNSGCFGPVYNTVSPLVYTVTTCAANTANPGMPTGVAALNSIAASWTASATAGASYILEVSTDTGFTSYVSGYDNLDLGTGVLTTNITGLAASTTYYIRIRAAVGPCKSTNATYLTIATQCPAVAAFAENFDSVTTPALPACWSGIIRGSGTGTSSITTTTVNNSAPNGLSISNSSATNSDDLILVSPLLSNLSAGTHQLRFYARNTTASQAIEVGTLTGSGNGAIFTVLQTVPLTTTFAEYTVSFAGYTGTNTNIGIRRVNTSTFTFVYLDNIVWEVIPTCYPPTGLNITAITTTGATLNWTAPTVGTPVTYEYEVRTSGAAGSGATGRAAFGSATAPALTIAATGLTANTAYSAYVRSSCGGSDYSAWTVATAFTTACNPLTTLPHSESFDAATLPSCWTTSSSNAALWAPAASNDGVAASRTGARFAGLSWTSASNTTALLVSPAYNLTANPYSARVNVWIYRNTLNGLDTDRVSFYVNNAANLTGAATLLDISLRAASEPVVATSGWYNYTAVIPNSYITGGTFYVIAKGTTTTSSLSYSVGFDDYALEYVPTSIAGLSPSAVCSHGGDAVTISGANFTGATAVKFNGVNAASFTVVNSTTITAITPADVAAGTIAVTGFVNTAVSTASLNVIPTPVVADVTGGNVTICSSGSVQFISNTNIGTTAWSSSNEAVATVNESTGLVTAVGGGTATITYTAVSNGCTASKSATITVADAIAVTSFTASQTVTPGDDTQFTVVATGAVSYQWYVSDNGGASYLPLSNDAVYSGVTSAILAINDVDETFNNYRYQVIITGAAECDAYTSIGGVLNVSDVGITTQPQDLVELCGGGNASLTVVATGSGLTYQWYENRTGTWLPVSNGVTGGVTYGGATSATLSLNGLTTINNNWLYQVYITDATSAEAISSVTTLRISTAANITLQPQNQTVCYAGGTVTYTVTATGTDLSYAWQYSTTPLDGASWTAVTNAVPVGVTYTGTNTNTLSVTTTGATPNVTYYYRAVAAAASPCGSETSGYASLIMTTPVISQQPVAASAIAGTSATFTVAGPAGSTYQWEYAASAAGPWGSVVNGTPSGTTYSGNATAMLTVNANSTAAGSYYYRAVVTSGECSVNSDSAQLTVTGYCIGTFTNAANPDYMSAIGISGTTLAATPPANAVAPYYTLLTGAGNTATLNKGYVYTVNITASAGGTTQGVGAWIDLNDDGDFADTNEFLSAGTITSGSSGTLTVTIPASAPSGLHRMRFRNLRNAAITSGVSCSNIARGTTNDFNITIGTGAAPTITSFTPSAYCAASGVITITGTNLLQGTLKIGTASITPITINPAGTQITATVNAGVSGAVAITTPAGTVTGDSFAVTLQPALTLSASSGSICPGGSVTVTVTAGASDYTSYVWSAAPTGPAVTGSAGTGFTFSPVANTVYTLTASNAAGCERTATYSVSINGVPGTISVTPSAPAVCSGQSVSLTASGGISTVQAVIGSDVTVNGASGFDNTSWPAPYGGYFENSRQQYLIRASELTALGLSAGSSLRSLTFDVTTLGTSGLHKQYTIGIGNTSQSAISTWETGLTTVFGPVDYQPVNGANTHNFTTNFVWNGTSNIIIQVCHTNDATSGATAFTANAQSKYSTTAFNSSLAYRVDNTAACSNTTITYTQAKRPNMVFGAQGQAAITWSPVTGLSAATGATVVANPAETTTYTVTATNGAGCITTGTVTVTVSDKEWTGALSTDWNTAGNWCGSSVPTNTDKVVIPLTINKPVISGGIIANASSLKIATGATLLVQSGNSLKVVGVVDLEPGVIPQGQTEVQPSLTVENNANLVQVTNVANTGTGKALIHRNGSEIMRNDYTIWSSPVEGQQLLAFSPYTLTNRFSVYNTVGDNFTSVVPGATSFAAARGYLIRMPNAGLDSSGAPTGTTTSPGQYQAETATMVFNGKFKGKPLSGDVPFAASLQANGYNAIGNPYPSPISIAAFFAGNVGNTNGIIYLWRKRNLAEASAYCTVNSDGDYSGNLQPQANNPNGILQTGQGFIVKATAGTINFTNAMRSTSTVNDNSFFRTANNTPPAVESHRIWLNLSRGTTPLAQMLVAYKSNSTMGVDAGIDAPFINDVATGLNSVINGSPYAIQGRSLPFSNADVVPLQFRAGTAGTYSITIDHVDGLFLEGQNIYIKDNLLGTTHDITNGAAYSFATEAGTFNSRFEVVYTNVALGTDDPVLDPDSIVIYKNDGKLHINTGNAIMKEVRLFDIRGRLVYEQKNINASTTIISGLSVQEEMMIVQVTTIENAKATKKVIY